MLKTMELFNNGSRRWIFLGRDPQKPDSLIDSNQYLVTEHGKGVLLDPGGLEIFPSMIAAVSREIDIENIESLVASHQDPDIISSLSMWYSIKPKLNVYASWIWCSFIPHFGGSRELMPIPDEGMTLPLGNSRNLQLVPAHYCHSSGNFSLYDPVAKILFSGDIGAALVPPDFSCFVEKFDDMPAYMEGFHKRWMPSNRAKNDWIRRVRALDIDMMVPQHGAIFRGKDVQRFLDWFETIQVGSAVGISGAPEPAKPRKRETANA